MKCVVIASYNVPPATHHVAAIDLVAVIQGHKNLSIPVPDSNLATASVCRQAFFRFCPAKIRGQRPPSKQRR